MGKRPDQYQIDPAEAGATDYKNLPQTGRGHSNLDDTVERDKQRLAQSEAAASNTPYNPGKPAPSQHANAPLKDDADEASPREREAEGTEDPRERGVGA
jgi:hypothetical protein